MVITPKGTKDVLPQDSHKWQYLENKAREMCKIYNFKEIRTPTFEHTEAFLRSIGEDTDVVSKEMYTFLDKGNRSITLKPEGTAGVARSYIENSLESLSLPLKMYYITPVFRQEKPQAGRYREHHQFGVEVYGADTAYLDYEVINIAYNFLNSIGISEIVLNINSIGCSHCRKNYNEALKAFLLERFDDLCPTCRERFERNPLRILDCKVPSCKNLLDSAPKVLDYICEDCKDHMSLLEKLLKTGGIKYEINPSIVRGLDYYTKTVFEFVTTSLGSQGTVCGGGRYNNLVESLGGKPTPCVGFGMGLERLLMLIEAQGMNIENDNVPCVFIASQSPAFVDKCVSITSDLRKKGIPTDMDFSGRSLKAQFKYADKLGSKFVAVIGENEVNSGEVELKNMANGEKTIVKIEEIDKVCGR